MIYRILFLALFCVLTVSCSSTGDKDTIESTTGASDSPQDTPDAKTRKSRKTKKLAKREKSLDLPPDLINSASDEVRRDAESAAKINILPEIIGARIQKQNGQVWLEIDTSVEVAWDTITEYWLDNGVSLVEDNPEEGTMETEWIKQKIESGESDSTLKKLFKGFLNTLRRNALLDKYRIRFERVSPDQTIMFVSHRTTARKAIERNKEISEFEWVELPPNREQVIDFLQNIILIFDQSA